ncbi:GatB/YqeY domain-containing protein [Candidatus Saccharibacteria bacterium]|jgi:uncharacterized protein YqeY|nr:GatB/YqeY domain-containing protein [Candidatus Saccharibacteria bacterium]
MSLKDTIQNDTKAALLSGNRFVGDTLRNLKAAILDEEVATGKREEGLSDSEIEKIIAREVKKRNESIAVYKQNGREDLADNERKEAEVLVKYLPEQLSEDELSKIIDAKISDLGVSGPQAMGQVIGAVKQQVGTSADGALIAKLVKEKLN